jgi:hypothetical protein
LANRELAGATDPNIPGKDFSILFYISEICVHFNQRKSAGNYLVQHQHFTYLRPMRVIGEIPHPQCKITLFHWNNRYLIKLEQGPFEQTFKIQEYDLASEADIKLVVSEEFVQAALQQFNSMNKALNDAMDKV